MNYIRKEFPGAQDDTSNIKYVGPADEMEPAKHILLTIDVEDWFQVQNLKPYIPHSTWSFRESRVERNTHILLDLLDSVQTGSNGSRAQSRGTKATFFVLCWSAASLKNLVREIHRRGHEIGSHGISHELCDQLTSKQLINDIADSRKILEDMLGSSVFGYRAPSFSINEKATEIIREAGYVYDSSFNSFSGNGRYGKIELGPESMGIVRNVSNSLYELPISNLDLASYSLPFGGGAYFRLFPYVIFSSAVRSILNRQRAYLFYMHPWEIDPGQPKVNEASFFPRFKHYHNLDSTLSKLLRLLEDFEGCDFMTCMEYIERMERLHQGA